MGAAQAPERGRKMGDWLINLPLPLMALVVFAATFVVAAIVYLTVFALAVGDRARAFKAVSPGMLPPLGILFALLVGFIAVEVWSNFDKAKAAVATEASAIRAVLLLADAFPPAERDRIHSLIDRHVNDVVANEWPAMAQHRATLTALPTALIAELHEALAMRPGEESGRAAQPEMIRALHTALDARRQRITLSQTAVGTVKWAGILLQGLCVLIAIAMVHSDNRLACGIALTLFGTGIALSVLLIAAYSRPFTGDISVKPDLLRQVIAASGPPPAPAGSPP